VASRTYAATRWGNLGSGIPAGVDHRTGAFSMPGLVHDADFRSSIAVMAGSDADVSAAFQLFLGHRGAFTALKTQTISAGRLRQWTVEELFGGQSRSNQPMTVKVILSQPGIAFATLVDNASLDSVVFLGEMAERTWIVPVVAHVPGQGGTLWTSSVTLWNASSIPAEIELEYLPENTDNSQGGIRSEPFMIGGYGTVTMGDVLASHFNIASGKGALLVTSTNQINVTSRVWTAGTRGGTIGNGVRAVHASSFADGEVVLPGVRMIDQFRTNVGVVTADAWATLEFKLRDCDGIQLATKILEVPPRTLKQLSVDQLFGNRLQAPDPVGSLVVASGEKFLAYLTVIDETSQDPVFVMAR
jgi:hypothetical protein